MSRKVDPIIQEACSYLVNEWSIASSPLRGHPWTIKVGRGRLNQAANLLRSQGFDIDTVDVYSGQIRLNQKD